MSLSVCMLWVCTIPRYPRLNIIGGETCHPYCSRAWMRGDVFVLFPLDCKFRVTVWIKSKLYDNRDSSLKWCREYWWVLMSLEIVHNGHGRGLIGAVMTHITFSLVQVCRLDTAIHPRISIGIVTYPMVNPLSMVSQRKWFKDPPLDRNYFVRLLQACQFCTTCMSREVGNCEVMLLLCSAIGVEPSIGSTFVKYPSTFLQVYMVGPLLSSCMERVESISIIIHG